MFCIFIIIVFIVGFVFEFCIVVLNFMLSIILVMVVGEVTRGL